MIQCIDEIIQLWHIQDHELTVVNRSDDRGRSPEYQPTEDYGRQMSLFIFSW